MRPYPRPHPLARRFDRLPVDGRWPRNFPISAPDQSSNLPGLSRSPQLARIEAILFSSDEPLPARRLATLAQLAGTAEARDAVLRLQEMYVAEGAAFQIEELAGGFQLLTRRDFHPWLVRLRQNAGEPKLSGTLLETLAIVAYRQPIMRADLESIRGVHCGEPLRLLMERGLIRITGRHESLGRPVMYGTTKKFLQTFGLRDLRDLPPVAVARKSD